MVKPLRAGWLPRLTPKPMRPTNPRSASAQQVLGATDDACVLLIGIHAGLDGVIAELLGLDEREVLPSPAAPRPSARPCELTADRAPPLAQEIIENAAAGVKAIHQLPAKPET
jgi:hypothetical protein